mgnify:CR=1 FL=1
MELAFEKNAVDHLQKLVCQVVSQEETAETVVPDSLPDVGRIVGCWGVPVVRSKEWRQNGMGVSGGGFFQKIHIIDNGSKRRLNIVRDVRDEFRLKPLTLHALGNRLCHTRLDAVEVLAMFL